MHTLSRFNHQNEQITLLSTAIILMFAHRGKMKRIVVNDAGLLTQTSARTRSALTGSHLRCYCKQACSYSCLASRVIFFSPSLCAYTTYLLLRVFGVKCHVSNHHATPLRWKVPIYLSYHVPYFSHFRDPGFAGVHRPVIGYNTLRSCF